MKLNRSQEAQEGHELLMVVKMFEINSLENKTENISIGAGLL